MSIGLSYKLAVTASVHNFTRFSGSVVIMAHVEQLYTNCLAQAAYFVWSEGEAVVIDPMRDPRPYMELAEKHNVKIKYVIETHFHADFVSGHTDLAEAAKAVIVFGPTAQPNFDAFIATDGEVLRFGAASLTVLHTPGHTMESSCFVLYNNGNDVPVGIFTGDTLFIGDVGRPDLAQLVVDTTQEGQARKLYQSLRNKIMPLPDSVIVYPGHGAGSACGKNMSKETTDLLGNQKLTNYALRPDMSEDEFVTALLEGLREPPAYFVSQVVKNKGAAGTFADAMSRGQNELTVQDVKKALSDDVLVFDTRHSQPEFAACHIANTVYSGTSGSLALWIATVFKDVHRPYIICTDGKDFEEGLIRLTRVGFDHCLGHLKGGLEAWKAAGEPTTTIEFATTHQLQSELEAGTPLQVIDVRGPGEYRNAHLEGAINVPLCSREAIDFQAIMEPSKHNYVYCVSGYRAMMYLSICRRAGVTGPIFNVQGGMNEIQKSSLASKVVSRPH